MSLKRWQRIFVNRSLNMGNIKAIGFDMDHTLAPYNHVNFETLAFKKTLEKFIEAGYPEELNQMRFDPNSVIRGLLVDRERGNLLKVDAHKYVKLAFHGKRQLDKEERHRLYNRESFKAENLLSVDTFFALSEVQLFIELVDFMDKHPGVIDKSYREVYHDLRSFIDLSHADGSIKNEVMNHPERYISRDKYLANALLRLRDGGKKIFLLTNSDYRYTNVVMTYLLNGKAASQKRNWRDYFDLVIVSAGKPRFFTGQQTFKEVDSKTYKLKTYRGALKADRVYSGGNVKTLQKVMGVTGDEVLYVGDHIYGDVISPKGLVNWRTMLIVEELDQELHKLDETNDDLEQILGSLKKRELFDEELQKLQSKIRSIDYHLKLATKQKAMRKVKTLQKELNRATEKFERQQAALEEFEKTIKDMIEKRQTKIRPVWGELMKVGMEKSRFANQVEQYACIYSSRATNLRFYSAAKKFVSFHDLLPHELFKKR